MGLHAYLRETTGEAHHRTDALLSHIGCATLQEYSRFLGAHAAALFALEAAIEAFRPELEAARLEWKSRAGKLRADLDALEGGVFLPPIRVDPVEDLDAALGVAYVLEGSRLGGRMIARQIRATNGMETSPLSYLDEPVPAGFWQRFTQALDEAVPDQGRWPRIAAGALSAFAAFERSAAQVAEKGPA